MGGRRVTGPWSCTTARLRVRETSVGAEPETVGDRLTTVWWPTGTGSVGPTARNRGFAERRAGLRRGRPVRDRDECAHALDGGFDEVYQLAADMGGIGFVRPPRSRSCATTCSSTWPRSVDRCVSSCSREPVLLRLRRVVHLPRHGHRRAGADRGTGVPGHARQRVRVRAAGTCASPLTAAGTASPRGSPASRTPTVRREPGPAGGRRLPPPICRKVAEVDDGGEIEVWGDGTAVRSYTYVDDLVDGILLLTASDRTEPANIGNPEYVSVNELVATVAAVAGKTVHHPPHRRARRRAVTQLRQRRHRCARVQRPLPTAGRYREDLPMGRGSGGSVPHRDLSPGHGPGAEGAGHRRYRRPGSTRQDPPDQRAMRTTTLPVVPRLVRATRRCGTSCMVISSET